MSATFAAGSTVAQKYKIEKKLAEGGMGQVYTAIQAPFDRLVVLKVMHPHLTENEELKERFFREAKAVSKLSHPNTVTVFDFGEAADKTCFIAMEFIDGPPLTNLIRSGVLTLERTVFIVHQVAQSLAEAHKKNIVHRDLKPDNIMISTPEGSREFAHVLDFGIAKMLDGSKDLTAAGTFYGTPTYMSPEQGSGEKLDGRSDLYALGCVLYEMLSGRPPFVEETPIATLMAHTMKPPPAMPATVPQSVQDFVLRALAKKREDRPLNADAFSREFIAAASPHVRSVPTMDDAGAGGFEDTLAGEVLDASTLRGNLGEASTIGGDVSPEVAAAVSEAAKQNPAVLTGNTTIVVQKQSSKATILVALAVVLVAGVILIAMMSKDETPAGSDAASEETTEAAALEIVIDSKPGDATVFINDEPYGSTPITWKAKPDTKANIRLEKYAYETIDVGEIVASADKPRHFFELDRKTLVFRVTSPIDRAELFVKDMESGDMLRSYGKLLVDEPKSVELPWPESRFRIVLQHPDYEPAHLELNLETLTPDFEWEPDEDRMIPKEKPDDVGSAQPDPEETPEEGE